ncbi:glycosyltransferase family 39 protein [Gloeocapsa sp. PCC 73106]|uniref:ArnT family glycosyltransferase n=1 Tax=Gloeocapsa sp. PCC 73106 TaxID=102232 RepID=UPI0002AC9A5B|nr:glycosyltransferase family 39 protein [Gloeocapsa sp. PCC 73106]ELR96987.1 hypothetical protein GLO73106DRAFT_00007900 [Gloeocapsa sp. PCC 73106]
MIYFRFKKVATKDFLIITYLLLLTILIRFPFFFEDVINWDESTLILMGQSLLDGHLPYTELWDLKPPIAFLAYAIFITIFGKSIISIRIGGALAVALSAFFTYFIGKTVWNTRVGILAGIIFILSSSFLPAGQATMTEHLALVPLVGVLYILISQEKKPFVLFLAGILMAIATMIRLNFAYVAVIVGLFILLEKRLKLVLTYSAGFALIVGLTYLPYAFSGYHQIWWDSVIRASLNYSDAQLSLFETFVKHFNFTFKNFFELSTLVLLGGVIGFFFNIWQWRNFNQEKRYQILWLNLFLFGTVISILKSGAGHSHYLIQLTPFIALISVGFLDDVLSRYTYWLMASIIVVALGFSMTELTNVANQYKLIASHLKQGQKFPYGVTYEIAAYLRQENTENEPIYLMTNHLVYWHLNAKPLTKISTHPSNISKDYLLTVMFGSDASTEKELTKILSQKPRFIVKDEKVEYLSYKPEAKLLLEKNLRTNYQLVKEIDGIQIYSRIKP